MIERLVAMAMTLGLMLCVACADSAVERLDTAAQLVRERPDTAYAILRDLDYDDFHSDSLKARFVLTKAIANLQVGRSLVTDTLLDEAAEYFRTSGDTRRWVIATQLLSGYDLMRGEGEAGIRRLEALLPQIKSRDQLWDTHIYIMDLALTCQEYPKAYKAAKWLYDHTEDPEGKLIYTVSMAGSEFMQGNPGVAVALMEDAISKGLPEKAPGYTQEFYLEYADMLNGSGQSQKAIGILDRLRAERDTMSKVEEVSWKVSEAEYYANAGDPARAKALLGSINHEATQSVFEIYSYIGMLKVALAYKETGHIPAELMRRVTKHLHRSHLMTQQDREKALESVIELNDDNYRLRLNRQRLWLLITVLTLFVVVSGVIVYIVMGRRKRRLIEAEERAETLQEMLSAAETSASSSDRERLKAALLRQLGIFKIFAGSPTPQSRDALKKISAVGHPDATIETLVDWEEFYAMIDSLYEGFHSKLVSHYPDTFNDKELQIIILMKAGFGTKEIGVLTEQSSATIYTRKSVIRKKLGNPENGDLIAFLDARLATL